MIRSGAGLTEDGCVMEEAGKLFLAVESLNSRRSATVPLTDLGHLVTRLKSSNDDEGL
jgi:hypothetical protein